MKVIKRNAVQCALCQQVIESRHRHDFVTCACGHTSVDGGLDYLKRSFDSLRPIELSEIEDIEDNVDTIFEKEIGD